MIAKKRIGEASAILAEQNLPVKVRYTFVPFQLNPNLPETGATLADYYMQLYGPKRTPEKEKPVMEDMDPTIRWKVYEPSDEPVVGTTLHAHRLVRWSKQFGDETQEKVLEACFQLYFVEAKLLSSIDNLVQIASAAGLDGEKARAYLQSDEDREAIKDQAAKVKETTTKIVPYMVIGVNGEKEKLPDDDDTLKSAALMAANIKAFVEKHTKS